jgi:hypothetical protein
MTLRWYSQAGADIEFSADSDTYILLKSLDGFSDAPVTHLTKRAPYQDGESLVCSHFEPRQVSFDVRIQAADFTALQAAVRAVSAAFNPLIGPGALIFTKEDGSQYVLWCIGNNTPSMSPVRRTTTVQYCTIDLIAHDPFWYTYPSNIAYFGMGTLRFPFSFPFSFPSITPAQTLINEGDAAAGCKIVITGEITNPSISRSWTDAFGNVNTDTMSFTLAMTAGEVLTITTGMGNKTITLKHDDDSYDSNPFQYLDPDSVFWELVPGDNLVEANSSAISPGTTVSVEYSDKFVGV